MPTPGAAVSPARASTRPDRLEVVRVGPPPADLLQSVRHLSAGALRRAARAGRRAAAAVRSTEPRRARPGATRRRPPRLRRPPRPAPRLRQPAAVARRRRLRRTALLALGWLLIAAAATVLAGSVSGVLRHRVGIIDFPGMLDPRTTVRVLDIGLFDLLAGVLLTLLVALALQGMRHLRRNQQLAGGAGRRAESDRLSARFAAAAEQLGHERAAIRLAGVYALGRLADDWPDQQQVCIDVLCGYLRLPTTPSPAPTGCGARTARCGRA